ncbi:MAG TPA: DNA-3-methyladenine glycosylase [Saprospiraceae bacterium]|nr:DNA-3-methyladenine glycosylase [Saprospiraceae bacterium]
MESNALRLLREDYFLNEDVLFLAQDLIGKILLTELDGGVTSGRIVETEAYRAPEDRASHAYGNKRTDRTVTMFLSGGHSYVYLCYGIHSLFNIVTGKEGTPHAVLIRAIEPIMGIDIMKSRRAGVLQEFQLTRGPGSLALALGINRSHNARKLFEQHSPVRMYDGIGTEENFQIKSSKRIGVDSAGESAEWPWRFYIQGNPCVSGKNK